MPNGESKNWTRFIITLERFHVMHGRWPEVVHVYPFFVSELQEKLSREDFMKLRAKIELVKDQGNPFYAYDDRGNKYDYSRESGPKEKSAFRAIDWLDINEPQYDD